MSNELGATKINELINTAGTSDYEDDDVVSNILNELEGSDDEIQMEQGMNEEIMNEGLMNEGVMNEELMDDLSNKEDDSEDLFDTDNNIFNTSDGHGTTPSNPLENPENNLMENNDSSDESTMNMDSFLSSDMHEILNLVKYPIIVVIIVLLINNEFVVKHLSQIKLFITDEKINMYGYGLQAILAGLILLSIIYIMKICLNNM
tara:strand:- start:1433 stop:2044 length:612 start_codon:yes stop_codon:yes gene_type:complete